ncbi:hypothetical protein NM208_g2936 [Fusarium decemcellulare]|uniref:Uncharacterized protein n=1 Tax=Fusarium decemcellulare TaxID=57161 RepID=A0ACC1SQQ9_9HYPO|nr:hypothetical protein NM208_g2936 [Fusarium decemcellulare]
MKIPASVIDFAVRATEAVPINITANVPITIPSSLPPFAKLLDRSLASFSLEFQFWPTYAGNATGQPNYYVNQLLSNLGERTGQTPAIRVGGTSENTAYVDTSFQVWNSSHLQEVFGPFTHRSNTSIGKDWYAIAGNLPAGTEFTFGLNLYDRDEVTTQAQMLADAFQGSRASLTKDVTLNCVQIGNEPNFYFCSAASYVNHWKPLAHAVLQHIKMGDKGEPTFWIGSEVIGDGLPFHLTGTLEAGILEDEEIANATYVLEEHQYSGAMSIGAIPGGPPPGTLMNKASIRGNLSAVYSGMASTHAYGRTYYLGEANTYASEAIFGLSNTGESAIWTVDYMLKAASMGATRVYLHSTPNRMFAVFQPGWGFTNGTGIERPHIMPMYNGLLVVNEMVGTSGQAMIAEIETNNPALAVYGVWESGKLSRLALVNSNLFDQNDAVRSAFNVTLGDRYSGSVASVKRLSIPYTTATEGITWAGQSFETDSGAPSGEVTKERLEVPSVIISASEAVLISFV